MRINWAKGIRRGGNWNERMLKKKEMTKEDKKKTNCWKETEKKDRLWIWHLVHIYIGIYIPYSLHYIILLYFCYIRNMEVTVYTVLPHNSQHLSKDVKFMIMITRIKGFQSLKSIRDLNRIFLFPIYSLP